MEAINLIYWLLVVSAAGYFAVMLAITIGWFRISAFTGRLAKPLVTVSIVVAVRNEETAIHKLLKSLASQDYPASNFEVIIVDDHSQDGTRNIIEDIILLDDSIKINLIAATGEGKKSAISQGIKQATGQLVVTTDGDCEMGNHWLSRLVAFYQDSGAQVVIGPVVYVQSRGLRQCIFSLDFISLVASGAGSAGLGMPFLGNGANLAFAKEATGKLNANKGGGYASGDDVFLIQQASNALGAGSVQFVKDPEAVVFTEAPRSFSSFFRQRVRWASKAKGYPSGWARVVAVVVFCFNLMLTTVFFTGFAENWMFIIFGLFILLKLLIDIPLLHDFTGFVNKRKLMALLPFLEFVYPFYIVISGLTGLFFRFEWKGRKGLR